MSIILIAYCSIHIYYLLILFSILYADPLSKLYDNTSVFLNLQYFAETEKGDSSKDKTSSNVSSEQQDAESYKKLMEEWNKKKPNEKKMKFYLLSEKRGRRSYIDYVNEKVEDKVSHILERYPMFKDINMVSAYQVFSITLYDYIYKTVHKSSIYSIIFKK